MTTFLHPECAVLPEGRNVLSHPHPARRPRMQEHLSIRLIAAINPDSLQEDRGLLFEDTDLSPASS